MTLQQLKMNFVAKTELIFFHIRFKPYYVNLIVRTELIFFHIRFKSCCVNLIVLWTVSALTKATQLAFRPLGKEFNDMSQKRSGFLLDAISANYAS